METQNMVDVSIENLTKVFETKSGSETAVDGIDLEIQDGEFFSLVGPSGCGKTTTLRMIAGLESPTDGKIYFGEKDVTDLSPQERNIAMVFQNVALFPHKTVRANIAYGLKFFETEGDPEQKVEEVAEILQISQHLDKKPTQLSGGQQQRVSLGRAIVRDPNLILMDEPLSDLDAKLKTELRVEIQRINKELDQTMVYVTHDQEEAMTMSSTIGVMNDGKIVQRARPEELFQHPNNRFVSQFIGQPSMNLLEVRITDTGEILYDGNTLGRITDPDKLGKIDSDKSYDFGFRPLHVEMTSNPDESVLPLTLSLWEPLGATYILYLEALNGKELKVISDEVPDISESSEVGIHNIQRAYLFNREGGDTVTDLEQDDIEYLVGGAQNQILDVD